MTARGPRHPGTPYPHPHGTQVSGCLPPTSKGTAPPPNLPGTPHPQGTQSSRLKPGDPGVQAPPHLQGDPPHAHTGHPDVQTPPPKKKASGPPPHLLLRVCPRLFGVLPLRPRTPVLSAGARAATPVTDTPPPPKKNLIKDPGDPPLPQSPPCTTPFPGDPGSWCPSPPTPHQNPTCWGGHTQVFEEGTPPTQSPPSFPKDADIQGITPSLIPVAPTLGPQGVRGGPQNLGGDTPRHLAHLRGPRSPSPWGSSPSPCISGTAATKSFRKSNCCSSSMHCFLKERVGGAPQATPTCHTHPQTPSLSPKPHP